MAFLDSQNQFSSAQALTGTAVSTNVIDLGSDRNVGIGEPLSVYVTVNVAAAGGGTLTIAVQTDSSSSFGSAVTVATTAALAAASLTAGARVAIPLPQDTVTNRYLRLNYTMATMTGITLTSELIPVSFVPAETVYPKGYTIS